MIVKIAPVIFALVISGNGFGTEKSAERNEEAIKERVRYEVLTLYGIYEGVRSARQKLRDLDWPIASPQYIDLYYKAALETVGDIDDSTCTKNFGASGGSGWAWEKSYSIAASIGEKRDLDPHDGAKLVWHTFFNSEAEIKREAIAYYQSAYTHSFKDRKCNQNLDLSLNYLLQIKFEETDKELIESQLFMSMRILRCLWLMYPDYRVPTLETFISRNLNRIPVAAEILHNEDGKLSQLILNDKAMSRLEKSLLVSQD